jgi:hypothetical protein
MLILIINIIYWGRDREEGRGNEEKRVVIFVRQSSIFK